MGCWRGYLSGVSEQFLNGTSAHNRPFQCHVICLELMTMPLTILCFSIMQIGFTFVVPAYPGSPGKKVVEWVYECIYGELVMIQTFS